MPSQNNAYRPILVKFLTFLLFVSFETKTIDLIGDTKGYSTLSTVQEIIDMRHTVKI
jgi:hypothetical protein